jgi:hypothetical protein
VNSSDQVSLTSGLHLLQVTKREDSAAYAARTLSEIETCLGFRIHEGGDAEAESLSAEDIEVRQQQPAQPHSRQATCAVSCLCMSACMLVSQWPS